MIALHSFDYIFIKILFLHVPSSTESLIQIQEKYNVHCQYTLFLKILNARVRK